ncbi:NFX1-type zinc finger-containing protein 1-like [Oculina patagonica]
MTATAKEENTSTAKLLSRFCKDGLLLKEFKRRCQTFQTEVKAPAKWKDRTANKLEQHHETYKYREEILRIFVVKKESEGFKPTHKTKQQFFEELKEFSNSAETNNTFSDTCKHDKSESSPTVNDLFDQDDVKLHGVVVRKTDKKAWVLVKKERILVPSGKTVFELIFDLKLQACNDFITGFPLKVGDIVEIYKRETETALLEPADVICCYHLSESEIKVFLEHVLKILQSDGSTAAVTELIRYHAAWDYTLQFSMETCDNQIIAHNVLYIIDEICSSAQGQMPLGVEEIVQQFSKSAFFKSFLLLFVENTAKESCNSQSFKMVQSILDHVLRVSPASGPRVLPMAKVLAGSLVNNSNGQSAIDFLEKLAMTIAIKVPGVHADLEALSWRELPLLPVSEEIQRDTRRIEKRDLPVIKEKGQYQSEQEYLNTYFRLLREECFHKMRKGISEFVNNEKCDSKDVMIYRIALKGLFTYRENSPTTFSVALKFKVDSQEMIDWGSTSWLRFGNLLCISFDDSFEQPVWAMLEKVDHEQSAMWVTLCEGETNIISEAEFITKMQKITDRGEEAYMAESQTFYLSFAPALDILQHKDFVPFKEFLVYPVANFRKQADYIDQIRSPPDWEIIVESPPESYRMKESSVTYSFLKEFKSLKCSDIKKKLDDTQLEAVELAFENKVALIQGPPGTGKSFVGVALVRLLLSMCVPKTFGPILVVTFKNNALDHFLEECVESSPKASIVRVGGASSSDRLKDHLLTKVGSVWPEPLNTQKRKLQLRKLQDQVKQTYSKLQRSSIFNAEMFLKEASRIQIKELLINSKRVSVDPEEVERLLNERNVDGSYKSSLKGYVKTALGEWLPSQDEFNQFASKMSGKSLKQTLHGSDNKIDTVIEDVGLTSTRKSKKKSKVDQEQENPDVFREPSTEENERLSSALEDELPVEDVKDYLAHDPVTERKLICIDKGRMEPFNIFLDEKNVWKLDEHKKIQLVYALQSLYVESATSEFLEASKENTQKHQQYKLLRNKHDIDVLRKCDIIGMTVTGAAMRANLLAEVKPSVMIVEEAAEILEGQLVAVIPPSVQHLIMIGDHEQLRPVVQSTRLRKENNLELSMFERLANCQVPLKQLGLQGRMRDEIVELLRKLNIYKELKTNYELVRKNDLPDCVEKCMFFCYHTSFESASKDHSKRNSHEAREITKVAERFCQEGRVLPSRITVLCAYRGQVTEMKECFKSSNVEKLSEIKVTTIDSFQGQENDIILISLVRSNKEKKIGYLSQRNRLCVAISRARCGLYLFGNQSQLASARVTPNNWKVIIDYMEANGCLGRSFPFRSSVVTDGNSPSKDKTTSVSEYIY